MECEIRHDKESGCFDTVIDGHRAYVIYDIYDGCLDIRRTLVPEALGGKGLAGQLVKAAYDYARSEGLICKGTCSYAVVWLQRHPEYEGSASEDYKEGGCAIGRHKS